MSAHPSRSQPPIAVIGLSTLVPGATDAAGFWRDIVHARDHIRDVPDSHWLISDHYSSDPSAPDKTYAKRGAFMSPVDFEPLSFGTPPSTLDSTDTAQLLSLMAAEQVLRDAFGEAGPSEAVRERMGIILGASPTELAFRMSFRSQRPTWHKVMLARGIPEAKADELCDAIAASYPEWKESSFPGMLTNVIAGRVARHFDLHGSNYTTDAACASSLSAMSAAIDELTLGRADVMITGGVDPLCDAFGFTCFSKTPALSPTGDCRPFSADADGTLLGEAVAMFVLKRLDDAERDGDRIYAVVRGIGTSSDGRGSSIYAPTVGGQVRALRRAYASAGYGPETVELIEAHGTGTKAGDTAEVTALREVFTQSETGDPVRCALGSVKSQIGHTRTAAGAVGLIKAALALHHKILPATLKAERPDSALGLESGPFYLSTRTRPWIRDDEHPRRASVSSFGFGGTNFHVALEEHCPAEPTPLPGALTRSAPSELVLLSADSAPALTQALEALAADTAPLSHLARRTQLAFDAAASHRLCLVARDEDDLRTQASDARNRITAHPAAAFHTPAGARYACGADDAGRVALLFPGQGSQYPNMGAELVMHQPHALAAWDRLADFDIAGRSLHRTVFPPPTPDGEREHTEQLKATEVAQPALAGHALMVQEILDAIGFVPDCVAGHSFGELSALHAAGVYDADTLMDLARVRGELLRDAGKVPGAMLAVTASAQEAEDLVRGVTRVWVANYNSPTQQVLSGADTSIAKVEQLARERQIPTQRLTVSSAFHSPLIASATADWRPALERHEFREPRVPVYGNVKARPYPASPARTRHLLHDHVTSSVRFAEMILAMYEDGVRTFVEAGPGTVLTGLVGRILGDRPHTALSMDKSGGAGLTALHRALGALAVAGRSFDFTPLWSSFATTSAPPARTGMTIPISGPNPGVRGETAETPSAVRESSATTASAAPPVAAPGPAPAPTPAPAPAAAPAHPRVQTQAPAPGHAPAQVQAQAHAPGLPAAYSPAPGQAVAPTSPSARNTQAHHGTSSTGSAASDPAWAAAAAPWLHAFLEVQRQASEAHSVYQNTTSASHASYLDLARTSLDGLMGRPSGTDAHTAPAPRVVTATPVAPTPTPPALPAPEIAAAPAPTGPTVMQPPPSAAVQAHPPATPAPAAAPMIPAAPQPIAAEPDTAATNAPDGAQVALSIVAELTGYPVEMLTADMDLEVDLGVDSIKRVQILTRLREHFPGEADVDPAELARLRTIAEIADKLAALRTAATAADAPAPAGASDHSAPRTAVLRTGLTPVSVEPAAGGPVTGLRERALVITDDGNGVAECLAETLRREGIKASVVDEVPAGSTGVIALDGLRAIDDTDPDAPTRAVFTTLVAVAGAMERDGGVLVTVQDTGGDFGAAGAPERVGCAGIAALARTASNEWARTTVKTIDVERAARPPQDIAQDIANEILLGGDTTDVALSADGRRSVLRGAPETAVPRVPLDLGPNPVVVVTGGARGITAACVQALARAHRPKLLLLGRTRPVDEDDALRAARDEAAIRQVLSNRPDSRTGSLPSLPELAAASKCVLASREIRATLDGLAAAGAEVRYVVADATDRERMTEVLAEVRRDWGPVTGIIHAAGVLADHNIADKTVDQFDAVYGTKVHGLRTLLDLTQDDPLRLVCLFSSVSARLGTAGQSDYAAANQAMEHIAQAEAVRTPDRVVKAIAWGPWAAGMVSTAHAEHFRRLGVPLLDEADGVRAFMAELEQPGTACLSIAAGAADAAAEQATVTDILVGADTHPYLADHSIAGRPVVPVALVVEWFTRAARAAFPANDPVLIRDVRVLRTIALDKFGLEQTRLQLHVRPSGAAADGPLRLELKGLDGSLHYTAVADRDDTTRLPGVPELPAADLGAQPAASTYDGVVLFHGPLFHAIHAIDGLGSAGATAELVGVRELNWPRDTWLTDPAVVDGALQMACLWVASSAGVPSLPMGVREVRLYAAGPAEAPVRCTVRSHALGTDNATCDIWLSTEQDGAERVWAVLSGVELVYRPDASGDQRRSSLSATDA